MLHCIVTMVTCVSLTVYGLPWWLSGKEFSCQYMRHVFDPWIGKIPWSRKCQPIPVLLPGKSQGQRSMVGSYMGWQRVGHD